MRRDDFQGFRLAIRPDFKTAGLRNDTDLVDYPLLPTRSARNRK